MDNLLEKETLCSSSSNSLPLLNIHRLLYLLIFAVVATALVAGGLLLIYDVFPLILPHGPVSAVPLLLIGAASLAFQALIRPNLLDLFKASMVSAAFLLWGIDQLCPAGWFATTLGDLVIVLYVIDLGWMIIDQLKYQWQRYHTRSREPKKD